jgi:hypothetical protein
MLDGSPKLIAIDEEPNHQVVHALRLGKADRPAYQPLDPGAQVDVLALDLLRVVPFFNSLITVVGLTCSTRAVSRMPLAFRAISTICCFTSGD